MPTIAYITNSFPSKVEGYVMQEILELRRRGVKVLPCSARYSSNFSGDLKSWSRETLHLLPLRFRLVMRTIWLCTSHLSTLSAIVHEALFAEQTTFVRRIKALLHTFLGAYFAVLLEGKEVDHIHIHHGYFSCWIAMVAARLQKIPYSVTLHGSDLLVHTTFLQTKLAHCDFCVTVSEFNRQKIINHVPGIDHQKVLLRRMGVRAAHCPQYQTFKALLMLSVGRLHDVKNHAFLIKACALLQERGCDFACLIAGEGKERDPLECLIRKSGLQHQVVLLGHLSPAQLDAYYASANLVVLTSRSEGLPLALMEAMVRGKIVLAPAITGIPELITDGVTGFLYQPGSVHSFLEKVECIRNSSRQALESIGASARLLILEKYDRETNLAAFADLLLLHISPVEELNAHENFVLQQI